MSNILDLLKVGRPSSGLFNLIKMGLPIADDSQDAGADFATFLKHLSLMAGMNHIIQVNDCETSGDWTESDNGTFDYAVGSTGKRVGTNCLKLTATASTDNSQYVETVFIDESAKIPNYLGRKQQDWRDTQYLGFWTHAASSAHFGTDGELKVAIVNDGTLQTKVDVTGIAGTEHRWMQIDMDANSWDRDKVEAIRFYGNNTNVEDVYIDDIIRYAIQFNGGPYYGSALPIKSATTLSENHWCKWTIDGVIASSSSADVADIGPAWLGASSVVGDAKRSKWGIFPGLRICLIQANAQTVAGEGLEWAANGLAAGVSTGADENGFAKGLEAAGAQYDHIFAAMTFGGNFIS